MVEITELPDETCERRRRPTHCMKLACLGLG